MGYHFIVAFPQSTLIVIDIEEDEGRGKQHPSLRNLMTVVETMLEHPLKSTLADLDCEALDCHGCH